MSDREIKAYLQRMESSQSSSSTQLRRIESLVAEVIKESQRQPAINTSDLDFRFGILAIKNDFVTQEQVNRALEEQKRVSIANNSVKLIGDVMVDLGLLTEVERSGILDVQKRLNEGCLVVANVLDSIKLEGLPQNVFDEFIRQWMPLLVENFTDDFVEGLSLLVKFFIHKELSDKVGVKLEIKNKLVNYLRGYTISAFKNLKKSEKINRT